MSYKYKTHFIDWERHPTESDTDGEISVACNAEYAEMVTKIQTLVTCKKCLKAMNIQQPTNHPTGN